MDRILQIIIKVIVATLLLTYTSSIIVIVWHSVAPSHLWWMGPEYADICAKFSLGTLAALAVVGMWLNGRRDG